MLKGAQRWELVRIEFTKHLTLLEATALAIIAGLSAGASAGEASTLWMRSALTALLCSVGLGVVHVYLSIEVLSELDQMDLWFRDIHRRAAELQASGKTLEAAELLNASTDRLLKFSRRILPSLPREPSLDRKLHPLPMDLSEPMVSLESRGQVEGWFYAWSSRKAIYRIFIAASGIAFGLLILATWVTGSNAVASGCR